KSLYPSIDLILECNGGCRIRFSYLYRSMRTRSTGWDIVRNAAPRLKLESLSSGEGCSVIKFLTVYVPHFISLITHCRGSGVEFAPNSASDCVRASYYRRSVHFTCNEGIYTNLEIIC
ncbi:unnamed protein product, partial [Ascophyllum nodosum]